MHIMSIHGLVKIGKKFLIFFTLLVFSNIEAQELDKDTLKSDSIAFEAVQDSLMPFVLNPLESDSIILSRDSVQFVSNDQTEHPLKPPNTESPRSTLQNFINELNRSYRLVNKGYNISIQEDGWTQSDEVNYLEEQAEYLFERGIYCLDLSEIPVAIRESIGYDMAFMLKEIIDRTDIPQWEEIPDAETVRLDLELNKYPTLFKWTIPNTDIEITRIQTGDREGEYLFSAKTVAHLQENYNKIKDLPYKTDKFISRDYYKFYMSTPGHLMPPKWTSMIPSWSFKLYYAHTIYQWFAIVLIFVISIIIIKLLYLFLIRRFRKSSDSVKRWMKVLFLVLIGTLFDGLHQFNHLINLTHEVFVVYTLVFELISWLIATVLVFNLINAISMTIFTSSKKVKIETTYTRAIFLIFSFFAASLVFVYGLSRIGVSVVPILTGLGIGGLAIALAARSTIENIIASFTIFVDKPYSIGDRVKVMEQNGTIEGIGIRSTHLRLLTGTIVSIPNEKMVATKIENIQQRPYIRRVFDITVPYGTSPALINRGMDIIKEILALNDPKESEMDPNEAINKADYPPRVHLNKFNPDSLNIYVSYWYFPPIWWDYMQHSEWVNLQIIERFNAEGIEFAFPTQTIHWSEQDVKIDSQTKDLDLPIENENKNKKKK